MFQAAYLVVRDTARQPYERAAALLVLGAQLDSSATVAPGTGVRDEPWRATLARVVDGSSISGSHSAGSNARERVGAIVQSITNGHAGSIARMVADPLYAAATEVSYVLESLPPNRPAPLDALRRRSSDRWN